MTDSARFIPARELSRQLADVIGPRVREMFPDISLSLAFIGAGSDVLGYDTARSMDHDWGPRLTIVVPPALVNSVKASIDFSLDDVVPSAISGFPTRFSQHDDGTLVVDPIGRFHRIEVCRVEELLNRYLLVETLDQVDDAAWLSTPMQSLLELTRGEVFVDDSGDLVEIRRQLEFYPDHIWRYQLAALWMRISQVQPFIGRCFEMGDRVGAVTIALGVIRDLMRVALLQSRQYVPYAKWLGTAFARIEIGRSVSTDLERAVKNATDFHRLQESMNSAGIAIIRQLNELRLIANVDPATAQFHSRPFEVLPAEKIAHALNESLNGTGARDLPPFVGGIDMVTDSTDALKNRQFQEMFREMISRS